MIHKVKLPTKDSDLEELESDLVRFDLTIGNASQALRQAALISEKMAQKACDYVERITDQPKKRWVNEFKNDGLLVKWFGKPKKKGHVKDVRNRMRSINKRIGKGLNIRLRPQKDRTANARNEAGFLDPKSFRVFPRIFKDEINTNYIASVYIHEMMHLWFKDQIIGRVKVNTERRALSLATYHPDRARKSAENYERFCRELYNK